MKLLQLSLENLASVSAPVTIDFRAEPLTSAGIFAITGKTGSGKSTLLDAICLALYATTPRYEKYSLKKGVEQMLHKGAVKGYARVLFQSVQGELYEAEWRIARKRARKGATEEPDVKTERSLRQVANDTVVSTSVSEIKTMLPGLLGLTYEQFTRSVMLAQGEFTSFLKADGGTKSLLLEKLTGTDLYGRVSVEVHERSTYEKAKLSELLHQKGNIEILGEGEREALTESVIKLETEERRLREEEGETNNHLRNYALYQQLETGVAEAREKQQLAQLEEAAAKGRSLRLAQVEAAVQVQEPMRSADEAAEILEQLHLHLEQGEKEEAELSLQGEEARVALAAARVAVTAATAQEAAIKPQIEEARRQDGALSLLEERLKTAGQSAGKAAALAAQLATELAARKATIAKQQEEEAKLKEWIALRAPYKNLIENGDLVQELLREKTAGERAKAETESALKKAKEQTAKMEKQVAQSAAFGESANRDLSSKLAALAALGLTPSKEEIMAGREMETLEKAQEFWKAQAALWRHFETTQSLFQNEEAKLQVAQKIVVQLQSVLENKTAEKQKAVGMQLQSAARLAGLKRAHSNSVAELRQALCSGDACPVCGSETHPAAGISLPAIDSLLATYEAEARNATRSFNEALRAEATAASEVQSAQKAGAQSHAEVENLRAALSAQLEGWQQAATAEEHQLPTVNRTAFYEATALKLEAQRKAYAFAQQSAQSAKLAAAEQNTVLQIQEAARAKQTDLETKEAQVKTALTENTARLKHYFTTPEWEIKWHKNPGGFAGDMAQLSADWRQKGNALIKLQMSLTNATETLQANLEKQAEAAQEAAAAKALLEAAEANLKTAQAQRKLLLAGKAVAAVEAATALRSKEAAVQLGIAEKTADRLSAALREVFQDRQQTRRQQAEVQQKADVVLAQIASWLSVQSEVSKEELSRETLRQLLQTTPVEIAQERAALTAIREAAQQHKVLLGEREAQLEGARKKLSKTTEENLASAIALLGEKLSDTGVQKAQAVLRLAKDNNGRAQLGDLLHRIETQERIAGRWQKLRELIGSSDGKAFRAIAQEYTLDILLLEANLQLAQLAPRYRLLRATGTLDLQIIDRDMGNEVRTVHSISGGESFLVALSLALGLAALSAGKQMVECLFIDEGFGMLDPATLHLALDALETLQQQGRKIGVISHIREMTDRIPVQIQVKKRSNGRSGVEVVKVVEG